MNPTNKWLKWTGIVLNVLIAGLMIFAGSGKLLGTMPPEVATKMQEYGLADQVKLIGFGELISAVLLLTPWTAPLGTLLVSGFWGGTICLLMSHHESFAFQSTLLAVTWLGSWLRQRAVAGRQAYDAGPDKFDDLKSQSQRFVGCFVKD